ncbi:MAG: sigma-70 family RNA polymerase sigma factor [Myxococcaceae bacterium]|nr:sigma-70 family RNA polymerase sigma factor [Myxococcaceae bacterium]
MRQIRLSLHVFDVDEATLAEWVTKHGQKGLTDGLALACGLFLKRPAALATFERDVAPKVRGALRKLGASEAEAEEHLQLARTRLLVDNGGQRLTTYRGVGAFDAFVTTIAVRLWTDSHRKPSTESDDALAQLPAALDLERALARSGQKDHFASAFRAALAALTARERTLLRLSLVEGASIDALAPMYGVSRATIARWVAAAKSALQLGTLSRLSSTTKLQGAELQGLMTSLESGFDMSLRRFVVEAAEQ